MEKPLITVVVPSYNQGKFLEDALCSIFSQNVPLEVFVMDGGSTDNSVSIIKKYETQIAGWRSHKDDGQSAAINEGIALGSAPYVCWLNSDDFYYENALSNLVNSLKSMPDSPAAYGKCYTTTSAGRKISKYLTLPFNAYLLANYCFICQPGTLIRRTAWEAVNGLDQSLHMAMDYDLWWKLFTQFGELIYCKNAIAATRTHGDTKTLNNIDLHYEESKQVVQRYYGKLPIKWSLSLPLMKFFRLVEQKLSN